MLNLMVVWKKAAMRRRLTGTARHCLLHNKKRMIQTCSTFIIKTGMVTIHTNLIICSVKSREDDSTQFNPEDDATGTDNWRTNHLSTIGSTPSPLSHSLCQNVLHYQSTSSEYEKHLSSHTLHSLLTVDFQKTTLQNKECTETLRRESTVHLMSSLKHGGHGVDWLINNKLGLRKSLMNSNI